MKGRSDASKSSSESRRGAASGARSKALKRRAGDDASADSTSSSSGRPSYEPRSKHSKMFHTIKTDKRWTKVPKAAAREWQHADRGMKAAFRTKGKDVSSLGALKDIQKYIAGDPVRLAQDTVLWKGMHPGRLKDRSLIATSTRPYVAEGFMSGPEAVLYRIHVPEGTPVMPIPPGGDYNEHEVLLMPGRLKTLGVSSARHPKHIGKRIAVEDVRYIPSLGRSGLPTLNPADSRLTLQVSSGHRSDLGSSFMVTQQGSVSSSSGRSTRTPARSASRASSTESTRTTAASQRRVPRRRKVC